MTISLARVATVRPVMLLAQRHRPRFHRCPAVRLAAAPPHPGERCSFHAERFILSGPVRRKKSLPWCHPAAAPARTGGLFR